LSKVLNLNWDTGYLELQHILRSNRRHSCERSLSLRRLTTAEALQFAELLSRRLAHEPIQYLVAKWDFLDYTFWIKPPLLCPRAETEELVLLAEKDIIEERIQKNHDSASTIRILDVGCGTGCIGISLFERLQRKLLNVQVEAIDVEATAIEMSSENAKRILGSNMIQQSFYSPRLISIQLYDPRPNRFHFVVSNPPYVPLLDKDTLEATVIRFESPRALFGGLDGMDVIRDIVLQLPKWCHEGAICWMEVDPTHPELLKTWMEEVSVEGVVFESCHQDLFGRNRFVRLRVTRVET
jgi:release factor glutamine methyltransferase